MYGCNQTECTIETLGVCQADRRHKSMGALVDAFSQCRGIGVIKHEDAVYDFNFDLYKYGKPHRPYIGGNEENPELNT